MERKITTGKLAAQISLALMTGMFSMVPVVYGAPVVDTDPTKINTADVSVSGVITNVTGTKENNVVHWQDFSVAKGETVQFDADNPNTARNYLNLVTGGNESRIDGAIKGGNDIYIVNPQGVIFGKGASVDVGSLYVSTTTAIDDAKIKEFTAKGTNPLVDTAASAAADIVNMGTITAANAVYVEGGNIKFMNTEDVTATQVTANAQGTVRFDHKQGVSTSNFTVESGKRDDYTLITTKDELQNINTNATTLSGHYALGCDILNVGTFVPLGTSEQPFTGAFDGNYYNISGLYIEAKKKNIIENTGLFGYVVGSDEEKAKISNLGVVSAISVGTVRAGALAGYIKNTDIENVFVSGATQLGQFEAHFESVGGLVGEAGPGVKINSTYVTDASILSPADYAMGGLVGKTTGNVEITNSYTKNISFANVSGSSGIVDQASDATTITNVYTTAADITKAGGIQSNTYIINNNIINGGVHDTVNTDAQKASSYAFLGDSTSNDTWRIYEGDSLPLLRSFLKANGTASVNYTYTRDCKTTTHNSAEDSVWTYNAETTSVSATSSVGENKSVDIRNKGTYTLFSSDQDGYDYVGGNVIIVKPYQIKTGINESTEIRKIYDGDVDASAAVGELFQGTSGGIFAADADNGITMEFSATNTPKFTTQSGADSPDAGVGKYVKVEGEVKLTGDTYGNYELVDSNDETNVGTVSGNENKLSFSAESHNGIIDQRELRIALKNATGIDREYNGETTVSADFNPEKQIQLAVTQSENGGLAGEQTLESIGLTYAASANYVDLDANNIYQPTKMAGAHSVEYAGIKVNGNYKLADAEGVTIYSEAVAGLDYTGVHADTGGTLYGTGTINKRNLVSTGFEWYTGTENNKTWHNNSATAGAATRAYTGSADYTEPVGAKVSNERNSTEGSGMLAGDSLLFTVQSATFVQNAAWEDADENGKSVNHKYTPTKNVNTATQVGAQGVVYTVTISDNGTGVANNYTLDGQDIVTTGTNTVLGAGVITPRTLNVVVNATKNVTKTYDGDATVKDAAGETTFGMEDGYLSYANPDDTDHHLLTDVDHAQIKITGLYQQTGLDGAAKNVNYTQSTTQNGNTTTTTYTVANKNIVYEAKVYEGTGDSAVISQNYRFGENGSATQNFTGLGQITPATITAVTFETAEKTYDGEVNVTNSTSEGLSAGQPAYKNDRIIITAVTGTVNNEGVQDVFGVDGNGQLALNSKVVQGQYGTLANGVFTANADVYRDPDTHEVIDDGKDVEYTGLGNLLNTRNYILADDLNEKAYGKGTIRALTITDGDWIKLDRNSTPITKVYDGTKNVAHDNVLVTDYLTDRQAYVQPTGTTNELGLDLTVADAEYSSQHQGTRDVTYKLSVTETGNYSIDGSLLTNGYVEKTLTGGGVITPRAITIIDHNGAADDDIVDHNITKTYDALPDIERTGEALITIEDQLVTDVDTAYVVSNGITAVYNDKNAGSKTVTYTLEVAGDTEGDYYFRSENSDTHRTTWTGAGTINKRTLNLSTTAEPSKTYGTYDADVTENRLESVRKKENTNTILEASDISFGSNENKTVVERDSFDVTKLTGLYGSGTTDDTFVANGDVSRDDDEYRTVLNKDIQYTGVLAALGDNAGNYEVANTFYGIGKIEPATIDHTAFKFVIADNVTQTYSGSEVVGEYGMDDTARKAFQRSWVDTATSGVDLNKDGTVDITLADGAYDYSINSAVFNSADAGEGNKTVTYNIHVDAGTINNYDYVDSAVAINAINLEDSSNTGTIHKRAVTASVTHDSLEKYYDGTTKIYNNDNAAYSGAASDTELSGANAVTFAPVVAEGTTTQTGLLDGTNVSTGAYVGAGVGTNNKTINYTAKVDAAHSGNYKFVDADGNELVNGQGTALTTTKNTIKPFGVVLTTADTTKTYDGAKGVTADDSTAALHLGDNYDNLALSNITDSTGVYDNPNVQGGAAHTVTYTGFTLNNNNYYLAKADGSAIDTDSAGNNVITGKGYITKYTLTDLPTFTISGVTKEYDTDALVKYNRSDDKDLLKENFVTAVNVPGALAYDLVSASYTDSSRGENKHVDFVIRISGDNYDFSKLIEDGKVTAGTGSIEHTYTSDEAKITPRKVYVSLDTTPEIKKPYDGDPGVEQDVTNMIIVREGDLLNAGTSLNRDASVINAQYDTPDAGDNKKVIYQVRLTGDGADNYEIHRLENLGNDTADIVYSTLEGKGKIDKATLTFNPDDHAFDRDYRKGDARVGLSAGDVVLNGVNGETVTLNAAALGAVTAEFGKGTGASDFTPDENVSWNGDTVVDKDIRFTGLDNALQYMVDNNVDAISKNYTIDGTAYFAAAKAKGKIKPITITQAATENWKSVTREYNADTDLQEVYDYSGTVAEPLGIKDILTLTLTHDGSTVTDSQGNALTVTYEATGGYDNQNVGDNHTLNYHINSVETKVKDAGGNANYILDNSVLAALVNQDVDSGAANNAGGTAVYSHITPRQLNASVVKDSGNRKIYDGSDSADKANFVVDADDQAILDNDGLLNNVVITARYGDKHASVNPDKADSNSKTIIYTLALDDNSGNYAIATPTATAAGDIERRKVYVDGSNAVVAPKKYDGNTDLPTGVDYNAMGFDLRPAGSTTGLVAEDADLQLDATQITGHYVSPDVKRAADGSVIAQNINITGFTLQDTDTSNDNSINDYVVIDADGSGVIEPLPVTVGIVTAPTKTYDGTAAIVSANDNVVVTSGLLAGESANILIDSSSYHDANAGTNKGYTYNITLDNTNYTLVQGTNAPDIAVSGNGLNGKVTAHDGTIEKRTITPLVSGIMSKEYDGTTDGTQNAATNVSLSNVVNGDNVGLTAKAVYDNPNAGKSETSDELQTHKVTYTLNLSNPNYQLAADTISGTGTISRKGLSIVATPVTINVGEALPAFGGTVDGLVAKDTGLSSYFTYGPLADTKTDVPGTYAVYGWYSNRTAGNFGLNYTFDQSVNNDNAFTVNYVNSSGNPDTKITPSNDVYNQISKDMSSGFGDNGAAALEYVDKSGNVIARASIDSGEIHNSGIEGGKTVTELGNDDKTLANIGIVGSDIVNLEGVEAASSVNIEMDGDGSIVNLQVFSLDGTEQSGGNNSAAEIVGTDSNGNLRREGTASLSNTDVTGSAAIQLVDESGNVLEENEDKAEKKNKEGEIAIESANNQDDDEIELTVEDSGVNVA